ncbi:Gp138 family membrane-puncturing spike protein [Pseudochelatococcus contaminans]|uniref:Phage protein Gp138 N-terminal domain-containing protein n=1 Tax=Pseudochelatococcus contaminans TaxID=1538103 RepID=A0A7W5Z7B1_9HYPH|nr:Gp138 family membrane-puncturing spike protein [Pseudochelatococcus contaminans]MBB3811468.1 hypothetical protein [Pseudochelatococcus contaminans]
MHLKEMWNDPEEAFRVMLDAFRQTIQTSMIGTVVRYNKDSLTVDVQPAMKSVVRKPDGTFEKVSMPIIPGIPVSFPGGGGSILTFPVKEGDPVVLNFASRSTDAWHQSGGEQEQIDARTLDLSDAVAHVGIRSQAGLPENVSGDVTQLRTNDGKTSISLSAYGGVSVDTDQAVSVSTKQAVSISATRGVTINSGDGTVALKGDFIVDGDVIARGVSLLNHVHGGVMSGPANTDKPVR